MKENKRDLEVEALERALGGQALLESLPVGLYCCDRDGNIQIANSRLARLWGRRPSAGEPSERFESTHKLLLFDGTPLAREEAPITKVLRRNQPVRDQHLILVRPDGERRDVLVNAEPIFGESGAIVGAMSCFQDITELIGTDEEIRNSEHELDDFFENSAVGLHIVNRDGVIVRANKAELELLGYEKAEYVGRHISEFHVDKDAVEDILGRLARGEQIDQYPARLLAKDGTTRHVLITSNALMRDGAFAQTRCFTIDVTGTRLAEEKVVAGERRFQDILQGMPVAVYMTDPDGALTFCNRAAIELAGRTPNFGVDKWCVFGRLYTAEGSPLPHEESNAALALKEKRYLDSVEFIGERPDGSRVRCLAYPMPLFQENGRLVGLINIMMDITERHRSEMELAHLAAIVSSSSDAIVSKSLDGIIQSWNCGAVRIFGHAPEEVIGQPITTIIPPELHHQEKDILTRLKRGERIEHFETARITKDGRRIDVALTVSPVHDRAGRVIGASKVARDITDRKRAERLQRLLISELNHRVKNTLATVQSIANHTVRHARTPAEAVASFSGRIQSLAHTHDILTRNSWQGADILQLVQEQLLLNGEQDSRISITGPSLTLDPHPSLHLALILHELGTNARKYGSLSVPTGRLDVQWSVHSSSEESQLVLTWRESGGPPVKVPRQRGFGTTLIKRSLASHGGNASIDYRIEGISCEITLPIPEQAQISKDALADPIAVTTSHSNFSLPTRAEYAGADLPDLSGTRILVVEDEPLIAMDIAASLMDAGCTVVGPAGTEASAESLIADGDIDAALLDANLNGRSVESLAALLARNKIPFAFLTGYEREALPAAFREAPLVSKPFTRRDAIDIVTRLKNRAIKVVPLSRTGR